MVEVGDNLPGGLSLGWRSWWRWMLLREEVEGGDSCVGVSQGVLWGKF